MDIEKYFDEHKTNDSMFDIIFLGGSTYGLNNNIRKEFIEIYGKIVPINIENYHARLSELINNYNLLSEKISNSNMNINGSATSIQNYRQNLDLLDEELKELTSELSNYKDNLLSLNSNEYLVVSELTKRIAESKQKIENQKSRNTIEYYQNKSENSVIEIKDNLEELTENIKMLNIVSSNLSKDQIENYNPSISDVLKKEIELYVSKNFDISDSEKKDMSYLLQRFLNDYAVFIKEKSLFEKEVSDEIKKSYDERKVISLVTREKTDDNIVKLIKNKNIAYFNVIRKFTYRIGSCLNAILENQNIKDFNNLKEINIVMYFISTLLNRIRNNSLNEEELLYMKNMCEKKLENAELDNYNSEVYRYLNEFLIKIEMSDETIYENKDGSYEEVDYSNTHKRAV